jgi:hypothetical protein
MHFRVDLIEAKSDVPLYITHDGQRKVITTAWQVLWRAPCVPIHNAVAALDMTLDPSAAIGFRVTCRFGHDLVGKNLRVEGVFNGITAISSPVKVHRTDPIIVHEFVLLHKFEGPVAYRGLFEWKLKEGHKLVATFETETFLELYTVRKPIDQQWNPWGISANLLRRYIPILRDAVLRWQLAQFYRFTVENIFGSPFQYDIISGSCIYASNGLGGNYKVNQYFSDLEAGRKAIVNCYDMAGIVQINLQLYPGVAALWNFLSPCGYINATM